jgi:hypothetical protein
MSLAVMSVPRSESPASPSSLPTEKVAATISRFTAWLDGYGELSYDFQSFFSSDRARAAKALY